MEFCEIFQTLFHQFDEMETKLQATLQWIEIREQKEFECNEIYKYIKTQRQKPGDGEHSEMFHSMNQAFNQEVLGFENSILENQLNPVKRMRGTQVPKQMNTPFMEMKMKNHMMMALMAHLFNKSKIRKCFYRAQIKLEFRINREN